MAAAWDTIASWPVESGLPEDRRAENAMTPRVMICTITNCPYCVAAKALLKKKGVPFEEVNLDQNPQRCDQCDRDCSATTVPQIFFGDRHVGGCEDLQALDRSGELDALIASIG